MAVSKSMSVQVYGCNHIAIEVDDVKKAVDFYQDVFNLQKLARGEGDAFFKLGEHQFLAIFEVARLQPDRTRHFGIMVRDEEQIEEVRRKVKEKYRLKLEPPFSDPEILRMIRAIEVLERIGSAEARTLLDALAAGGPGHRLTEDAREAAERTL